MDTFRTDVDDAAAAFIFDAVYAEAKKAYQYRQYPELTELIVSYIQQLFSFTPGFSTFDEIVIEYLSDQWICEPVEYISSRYDISEQHAQQLVTQLRKFSDFVE